MDLSKIPLFDMLTRRMNWLNSRQRVLSNNIANANTPDFTPLDLKKLDFRKLVLDRTTAPQLQLAKGRGGHLNGLLPPGVPHKTMLAPGHETTPAGNSVILEEQLMKMAETRADYRTTSNLYRKHVGMIKTALGVGNR